MIVVERPPPYLTVQDVGRPGYRASGVPHAGAMDQWSLATANILVGNSRSAAGLEWAIGGGSLRFNNDATIALAGADAEATIDEVPVRLNAVLEVRAGQLLTIRTITGRRFLYVSIKGGVDSSVVLGSRSTYQPAAFGGIEGRRLARGDTIPIGTADGGESLTRGMPSADGIAPDYDCGTVRVVGALAEDDPLAQSAPTSRTDKTDAFMSFLGGSYTVSLASDRTGYRLDADSALDLHGASITSRPVCVGAIQLPPDGNPIILMSDSPTIGGYRLVATVISCDLPVVAQCLPGRKLSFTSVSVDFAQRELRKRESFIRAFT